MADIEARVATRKVLRCRAKVMVTGVPVLPARTVDVSVSGISLLLEQSLPSGQSCVVAFETPVRGTLRRIIASAKVVYSVCGADGFRLGFQFVQLDAGNTALITEIVNS